MHILLVGAGGSLGTEIQKTFSDKPGIRLTKWTRSDYDITLPSVADAVSSVGPDIVINSAAWTDVDGAEQNADAAYAVNMLGPKYIAEGCRQADALLVHVSTNEIFAGEPDRFYREYDQPGPGSIYARSKYAGEQAIISTLDRYCIVRTAWLFSGTGTSFPTKILAAAREHGALRVVDDEFGNPTYVPDLVEAIYQLIETNCNQGIFHLVNDGYASRYTWAQNLLEIMDLRDLPLSPVSADTWQRAAKAPRHAVLKNSMAKALSVTLRPWQEAMVSYRQAMKDYQP